MKAQYDINKKVNTDNNTADIQNSGLMDPITKTLYCLPPAMKGYRGKSLPRICNNLEGKGDKESLIEKKSCGKKEVFADLEETLNQLRMFSETSFSENDKKANIDGGLVKSVRADVLNPFGYSSEDIEMVDLDISINWG